MELDIIMGIYELLREQNDSRIIKKKKGSNSTYWAPLNLRPSPRVNLNSESHRAARNQYDWALTAGRVVDTCFEINQYQLTSQL